MKSAGLKDKGKGFSKKLFSLLKVDRHHRHCRWKKTPNFLRNICNNVLTSTKKKFCCCFFVVTVL
jgi:hypothetical protein